jgi:hypothetical protein
MGYLIPIAKFRLASVSLVVRRGSRCRHCLYHGLPAREDTARMAVLLKFLDVNKFLALTDNGKDNNCQNFK